jgi:hypothetical protein
MTTLDKNVQDSLDEVHLHVDALLPCTTTHPEVNVQSTPVSASDLASALAAALAMASALALASASGTTTGSASYTNTVSNPGS